MKLAHHWYGQVGQPQLVLLHGWGMNSQCWASLIPLLEEDFHILTIDLPSMGESSELRADSIDHCIQQLCEVAPEGASWVGWSLGGVILQRLAAQHPQFIDKLMLVASNVCFVNQGDWQGGMDAEIYQLFCESFKAQPEKTLTRFIGLQVQGSAQARSHIKQLKQVITAHQHIDPEGLMNALRWLELDQRDQFAELNVPVALILGELDALVPAEFLMNSAERSKFMQLRCYEGSAHLPFIDQPERFVADLRQFFLEG